MPLTRTDVTVDEASHVYTVRGVDLVSGVRYVFTLAVGVDSQSGAADYAEAR